MNTNGPLQPSSPISEPASHQAPVGIEQVIEQIGARYITDLRMLSEAFHQLYAAQLQAKEAHIAELTQRVEAVERERDALQAQLRELKHTSAMYLDNLRAMSEELSRAMEAANHGHTRPSAHDPGEGEGS
jgi:chromosome segregation ATPase